MYFTCRITCVFSVNKQVVQSLVEHYHVKCKDKGLDRDSVRDDLMNQFDMLDDFLLDRSKLSVSVWWYHIPFLRDAHWLLPFPASKVIVRHIYVSFHLTEHEGYILLYIYSAECVEILYLISHSSSPKSAALCTSFYTTKNDCELSVEKLTARVELVFVVFNLNLCILFVQIYTCYPHTHKKS